MIKFSDMLLECFKAVEKEVIKLSTSKSQKYELEEELSATRSHSQTISGCSLLPWCHCKHLLRNLLKTAK